MLGTRRYPRSQVVSRFDQRDASLALHFPLWYQYSDMTGSTIYSYDRNRHTGTVTGATWSATSGRTFAGVSDVITVPDAASIRLGDSFSIEFLFNHTSGNKGLLSNNPTTTNGDFNIAVYGGKTYYFGKNTAAQSREYANLGATVNTGVAVHLVATRNGATFKDYINGVLNLDQTNMVTGDLFTTGDVLIGWSSAGIGYWLGSIGECRIYNNRVLTPGEVQNLYRWRHQ